MHALYVVQLSDASHKCNLSKLYMHAAIEMSIISVHITTLMHLRKVNTKKQKQKYATYVHTRD